MNTAAKLLLVAAAPLGAAAGSCDTFYGKAATYHVIDSGLGQPVDEYMNKWTPATWLRNGSYVATLMNGTVAQTGTCTWKDADDGTCASVCTAEGPGIPSGMKVSIRAYNLPESAGGLVNCYNFGPNIDMPSTCVGAKNFQFMKEVV